jgi:hypothetical protein
MKSMFELRFFISDTLKENLNIFFKKQINVKKYLHYRFVLSFQYLYKTLSQK